MLNKSIYIGVEKARSGELVSLDLLFSLDFLLKVLLGLVVAEAVDLDEPGDHEEDPVDNAVNDETDVLILSLLIVSAVRGLDGLVHDKEKDTDFVEVEAKVADTAAEDVIEASDGANLLDDVGTVHHENEPERPLNPGAFAALRVLGDGIGVESEAESDKERGEVDLAECGLVALLILPLLGLPFLGKADSAVGFLLLFVGHIECDCLSFYIM